MEEASNYNKFTMTFATTNKDGTYWLMILLY